MKIRLIWAKNTLIYDYSGATSYARAFFDKAVLLELFSFLREELSAKRNELPLYGINYRSFYNVKTKELGKRNVFIEYCFDFFDSRETPAEDIDITPFDIKIFDDLSEGIQDLIEEVKRKQKLLAQVNWNEIFCQCPLVGALLNL